MNPLDALMKRYDETHSHATGFERGFYRFNAAQVLGDLQRVGCTVAVPKKLKAEPLPVIPGITPEDSF